MKLSLSWSQTCGMLEMDEHNYYEAQTMKKIAGGVVMTRMDGINF